MFIYSDSSLNQTQIERKRFNRNESTTRISRSNNCLPLSTGPHGQCLVLSLRQKESIKSQQKISTFTDHVCKREWKLVYLFDFIEDLRFRQRQTIFSICKGVLPFSSDLLSFFLRSSFFIRFIYSPNVCDPNTITSVTCNFQ